MTRVKSQITQHKQKHKPTTSLTHSDAPSMYQTYQYGDFTVRIVRSARRQRTVSANLLSWRLVEVRAPASLPADELENIINHLIEEIKNKQGRQRRVVTDHDLQQRAEELNQRYFQDKLRWKSIAYVSNQRQRYGSCTPHQGTIRISDRLKLVPGWVLNYVLIHELAHLLEPGHNAAFWRMVNQYELAERARGYLMALQLLENEADNNPSSEG
ncbi:MAG: M48 family metallopeptidase [Chloroflexi bacterium]|nr:M48 family metallopeptidase [Chloroflexota bacterium]